ITEPAGRSVSRPTIHRQSTDATDRGEHRQAAGAVEKALAARAQTWTLLCLNYQSVITRSVARLSPCSVRIAKDAFYFPSHRALISTLKRQPYKFKGRIMSLEGVQLVFHPTLNCYRLPEHSVGRVRVPILPTSHAYLEYQQPNCAFSQAWLYRVEQPKKP